MSVVGLDQSYSGFGHCHNGVSKKKGFPASKYENPDARLFTVEDWLVGWLDKCNRDMPVNLVVMEGYANAAKFGREIAGELGWAVRRSIYVVLQTNPLVVPPTTLKKFVTGKGNAKKNEMLLGVYKQWGVEFSDDNQADAYALEMFGWAWLEYHEDPVRTTTAAGYYKYQIDAIKALKAKT